MIVLTCDVGAVVHDRADAPAVPQVRFGGVPPPPPPRTRRASHPFFRTTNCAVMSHPFPAWSGIAIS
jgi:hypothetical protein